MQLQKQKQMLFPTHPPDAYVQKQLSNINDNLYCNWNRNAVNKCRFALSLAAVGEAGGGGTGTS